MTFRARYDGRCTDCGESIREGDLLDWADGDVVHAECLRAETARPKRETCPECWQERSVSGTCGCDPA